MKLSDRYYYILYNEHSFKKHVNFAVDIISKCSELDEQLISVRIFLANMLHKTYLETLQMSFEIFLACFLKFWLPDSASPHCGCQTKRVEDVVHHLGPWWALGPE